MPDFPPVTMKTLPTREGVFSSVKVSFGGKNWVMSPPMVDWVRQ